MLESIGIKPAALLEECIAAGQSLAQFWAAKQKAAAKVATGREVIRAPPCIFPWWFCIENIQGCVIMALRPMATRRRRRPRPSSERRAQGRAAVPRARPVGHQVYL